MTIPKNNEIHNNESACLYFVYPIFIISKGLLLVAKLYRHMRDIEVFFKWVKQDIEVKTLWEYSENAARILYFKVNSAALSALAAWLCSRHLNIFAKKRAICCNKSIFHSSTILETVKNK